MQKAAWFSWMDPKYDEVAEDAEEIFRMLGFGTETGPDDSLLLTSYDNKTGQEELFLETAAPYVTPGSYIVWRGEDGHVWRNSFNGEKMSIEHGKVTFSPTSEL